MLSESHPIYLRRLAKEINKGCDAPYYEGRRILRASVKRGCHLFASFLGGGSAEIHPGRVFDGNGRQVIASREE